MSRKKSFHLFLRSCMHPRRVSHPKQASEAVFTASPRTWTEISRTHRRQFQDSRQNIQDPPHLFRGEKQGKTTVRKSPSGLFSPQNPASNHFLKKSLYHFFYTRRAGYCPCFSTQSRTSSTHRQEHFFTAEIFLFQPKIVPLQPLVKNDYGRTKKKHTKHTRENITRRRPHLRTPATSGPGAGRGCIGCLAD